MTERIIWIALGAVVAVGAIIWLGKAMEEKDEKPEGDRPRE